jgi:hypothetical protein
MQSCQPHDEHTLPHTGPAERPTAPFQQQRLGLGPKSEENVQLQKYLSQNSAQIAFQLSGGGLYWLTSLA